MSKNKKSAIGIFAIIFVLFNVIAFLIPFIKLPTYWIALGFGDLALILGVLMSAIAFDKANSLNSKVLRFSVFRTAYLYVIVQLIISLIFMAVSAVSVVISMLVCIVWLAFSAICILITDSGTHAVGHIEEKVKQKVFYIKSLQIEVEAIEKSEQDYALKEQIKKLAEKIRYSDPMSSAQLGGIENKITVKVNELDEAVKINSNNDIPLIVSEISDLLDERNQKCKLLK